MDGLSGLSRGKKRSSGKEPFDIRVTAKNVPITKNKKNRKTKTL